MKAEHLFDPFQQARLLSKRSLGDHCLGQDVPLYDDGNMPTILGHLAHDFKAYDRLHGLAQVPRSNNGEAVLPRYWHGARSELVEL